MVCGGEGEGRAEFFGGELHRDSGDDGVGGEREGCLTWKRVRKKKNRGNRKEAILM